jgi:ferritin
MQISEAMQEKLNQQVKYEFTAEHTYLAMAACFDRMGLKGFCGLFYAQAAEEHGHALRIAGYLMRVGARVELRGVDQPRNDYASAEEIVQTALDAEVFVKRCVHEITELAETEKDYATRSFIQWKVDEQVEEVQKMTDLLSLVKLAGPDRLILVQGQLAALSDE